MDVESIALGFKLRGKDKEVEFVLGRVKWTRNNDGVNTFMTDGRRRWPQTKKSLPSQWNKRLLKLVRIKYNLLR